MLRGLVAAVACFSPGVYLMKQDNKWLQVSGLKETRENEHLVLKQKGYRAQKKSKKKIKEWLEGDEDEHSLVM